MPHVEDLQDQIMELEQQLQEYRDENERVCAKLADTEAEIVAWSNEVSDLRHKLIVAWEALQEMRKPGLEVG